MSVRSFRSVFMVASCAGAALGCYLVSLRVATERASLEDVETRIVLAQRDVRLLQTEIGTRGRLAQLERWNAKVIALSAPTADQFLNGSFELAKLTAPEHKPMVTAPVVLASAPKPQAQPVIDSDADAPRQATQQPASSGPAALMHEASFRQTVAEPPRRLKIMPSEPAAISKATPSVTAKAQAKAPEKTTKKNAAATAEKKPAAKAGDKAKVAAVDPLAPKPAKTFPAKVAALSKASTASKTSKDSARKQ
jgi:hypothetical protein